MSACVCPFCGVSTGSVNKPASPYCSAGCALRAAVPVDADGNFPANGALAHVLVFAFLLFNQGLTALAAILLAETHPSWASGLDAASWVLALIVALYAALLQWAYAAHRSREVIVLTLFTLVHCALAVAPLPGSQPLGHFGINVVYTAWVFRGFLRQGSRDGKTAANSISKRSDSV